MNPASEYLEKTGQILQEIIRTQSDAMTRAAGWVADTISRDGIVYALGSGHSLLVAAELYFRAGGMTPFDIVHDKTFGRAERLSGYAKILLDSYPIFDKDLLIIVSNSGRNALPVEMALEARQRKIATIGITSLRHSRSVTPRTESGLRLFEACDLAIDNCGEPGDAVLDLDDGLRVGPTSTLAGIFIANSVVALAAHELPKRGVRPPVFISANLDRGDELNRPLIEFVRQRIRGL